MKLATVLRTLATPNEERLPVHEFDLIRELHEFLISPEAQDIRSTGSFNPSALDGCKRALAYNYLKAPVNQVHHEPRLMITFELGNYFHERFQDMFERMAKRKSWQFIPEMRILRTLNHWFVSGRCDGVFILPDGSKEGVEIKSMHKDGFNRLYDGPLHEHQYQGNLYAGLLGFNRMSYFYICKDNSQIKSFPIAFDKRMFEGTMEKIERILLKLQNFHLPDRIVPGCQDKGCKFLSVCWSGKTVEDLLQPETITELRDWKPMLLIRKKKVA
jgi:hypothetical protein